MATNSRDSAGRLATVPVRTKLIALGLVGILGLGAVGLMVFRSLATISTATENFSAISDALRTEMEADMSHDAIRSNVTQGLLFPVGSLHKEAEDGLAEESANIVAKLEEVKASSSDAALQQELSVAMPLVVDYVEAAKKALASGSDASLTKAQVEATYSTFLDSFNQVLVALPKVGDRLTAMTVAEEQGVVDAEGTARSMFLLVAFLSVVGVVLASWLVSRDIVGRLSVVRQSIKAMSDGDLSTAVPHLGNDEIGAMAADLDVARINIRNVVVGVNDGVSALQRASGSLSVSSSQGAAASRETTEQLQQVSGATAHVTSSMESLSAAAEEMSASIREIASSAAEASRVAQDAVGVVKQTSADVERLGRASAEIDEVVKVINGIADQTNLLALNATIEAARAGEAGKGFAVVAGEVKELASETAKATSDVSSRVMAIQAGAQAAVAAIEQISGIIERINDYQTAVAAAVEEQTATTNEMSRGISEIVASASQINSGVNSVAQAAELTTAGAVSTESSAGDVVSTAEELRVVSGAFRV